MSEGPFQRDLFGGGGAPRAKRSVKVASPRPPKTCAREGCGKRFRPTSNRQELCSPECARERRNARRRERYRERRQDPKFRERENARKLERYRERRQDPKVRERRNARQRERYRERRQDPKFRERENARNRLYHWSVPLDDGRALYDKIKGKCPGLPGAPCGKPMTWLDRSCVFDHSRPRDMGGRKEWDNVMFRCPGCNGAKGGRIDTSDMDARIRARVLTSVRELLA